jgi:small-conductance mechanosensitive channel
MNNQLDPLAHAKDTLIDLAIRFGPKLLVAILILTVGFFVAGWVARAIERGLRRLDLEPPVVQLLTRVARVLVVLLFAIMALQNLGVELLPLIAGLVVGEILHNYGRIRQAEVKVGVAYESDLPLALGAIGDLVRANPRVLADPAPVIQVVSLADSAVQIAVRPWVAVADYGMVAGELNVSLLAELRRRGVGIPYPQREVRLIGGA